MNPRLSYLDEVGENEVTRSADIHFVASFHPLSVLFFLIGRLRAGSRQHRRLAHKVRKLILVHFVHFFQILLFTQLIRARRGHSVHRRQTGQGTVCHVGHDCGAISGESRLKCLQGQEPTAGQLVCVVPGQGDQTLHGGDTAGQVGIKSASTQVQAVGDQDDDEHTSQVFAWV